MRDLLTFTFPKGYFNNGNIVEIPEGAIIAPSTNVLYNKNGRLVSFGGFELHVNLGGFGGTKAFLLDRNRVGYFGKIVGSTVTDIGGSMMQGVGKSLWFVGSTTTSSAVSVVDFDPSTSNAGQALYIGGNPHKTYLPIVLTGTVGAGTIKINFVEVNLDGTTKTGGKTFSETLTIAGGATVTQILAQIVSELRANTDLNDYYYVSSVGGPLYWVSFFAKSLNYRFAIDLEIPSPGGATNISETENLNDTNAILPTVNYSAGISEVPQVAKWNNGGWLSPVQVGLPELEDTPDLELNSNFVANPAFSNLVQGSRSVRIARKRYGAVSIASSPSNVVTASENGDVLLVTIPALEANLSSPQVMADNSLMKDNSWLLYFTYKGLGSTATHKLFPLEIPESEIRGFDNPSLRTLGNAKYQVVLAGSEVEGRKVQVEFLDSDLLAIDPLDDAYPAEKCKFIAKLGNTMCLVGTGDDQTGFDVSIPNNFEGYNPEWRDWLTEVPVSLAVEQDMAFFWIMTANNTYMAQWTGVTEGAAPVVLKKISSMYGAIGESASVCVNGMLYVLSNGKTPIIVSPNGQVNIQVGAPVQAFFTNGTDFDSTTEVSYDENTSSVVFSCKSKSISLHLNTGTWSAPITSDSALLAMVPINGNLVVSRAVTVSGTTSFKSYKWNSGNSNVTWKLAGAFQYGKSGRALKDIIQVEAVISSPTATVGAPQTITFKALKNYNNATEISLTTSQLTSQYAMISVREYVESLDYDSISALISGTVGGQSIHSVMYTVDVHTIERNS